MTLHQFQPAHYHPALGTYPPVLRLADGDSVVTTTVDAFGRDQHGEHLTHGPNPQTGPFFIEGAEPGDTLAVHFDRLWPNRNYGFSSACLAPNVVDPAYVPQLPLGGKLARWELDLDAGTAVLTHPTAGLKQLTLPLRPMLGCFGVAPAGGQAIGADTSGPHGGNMDYQHFRQGVTCYFPVAVEGALLFVGDGHALQGDGEIAGTGIETSFEVGFTVRLIKGRTIAWPRAHNATHLITIGNARPLDQALQHATTEMVRWLLEDYALEPASVHTLLGQCVEYDIGNVYDPAYTVACKIARELLHPLEQRPGAMVAAPEPRP